MELDSMIANGPSSKGNHLLETFFFFFDMMDFYRDQRD